MDDWERREMELVRKENAYYNAYTPFEKFVDNPWTYLIGMVALAPVCVFLGFVIGLLL